MSEKLPDIPHANCPAGGGVFEWSKEDSESESCQCSRCGAWQSAEAAEKANYSEYTHFISSEPSYYGSECTDEDAAKIVRSLGDLIRREFPGINVQPYRDGDASCKTTGPDPDVCWLIDEWVSDNWTKAL